MQVDMVWEKGSLEILRIQSDAFPLLEFKINHWGNVDKCTIKKIEITMIYVQNVKNCLKNKFKSK